MRLTSYSPHSTVGGDPDRGGWGRLRASPVVWGRPVHLGVMDLEQHQSWGLEPLISVDELAAYLGLPKQTIYDWRVSGKGPKGYRIGKHLRFAVSDVRAWVEQQRDVTKAG